MTHNILDHFEKKQISKFAENSFSILLIGIALFLVKVVLNGKVLGQHLFFDWWSLIYLITLCILMTFGIWSGIQSFRKNEHSLFKKYIGLGGNACFCVGLILVIFELTSNT